MSFKVIDIHPHVISTDLVKFPRDPLGGIIRKSELFSRGGRLRRFTLMTTRRCPMR